MFISLFYSDVAVVVTGYIAVISLPGVWSCTFVSGYDHPPGRDITIYLGCRFRCHIVSSADRIIGSN